MCLRMRMQNACVGICAYAKVHGCVHECGKMSAKIEMQKKEKMQVQECICASVIYMCECVTI